MNKVEAIQAMRAGKRVRHRFFSDDEFVTMVGDLIVDENGYEFSQTMFWNDRTTEVWENDWEIVPDKNMSVAESNAYGIGMRIAKSSTYGKY